MIWSVSMLVRGMTTVPERMMRIGSMGAPSVEEVARVGDAPGDRARGGRDRAREQRAGADALAALEVAVAGADAVRALAHEVAVHAEAHRAAGLAPVGAGLGEHAVEAFGFGLALDLLRAR